MVRSVILTFFSVCFSQMTFAYLSKFKSNYVFCEFKLTKSYVTIWKIVALNYILTGKIRPALFAQSLNLKKPQNKSSFFGKPNIYFMIYELFIHMIVVEECYGLSKQNKNSLNLIRFIKLKKVYTYE